MNTLDLDGALSAAGDLVRDLETAGGTWRSVTIRKGVRIVTRDRGAATAVAATWSLLLFLGGESEASTLTWWRRPSSAGQGYDIDLIHQVPACTCKGAA